MKDNPVLGMDNLYTLDIPELSEGNSIVMDIQSYHAYFLVVVESSDATQHIYMIHPLEEKIVAKYDLPYGCYIGMGSLYVNGKDEIIIRVSETGECYILNDQLQEQKVIRVEGTGGTDLFLSKDQKYVYYVDSEVNQFYCYDVINDNTARLWMDVEFPENAKMEELKNRADRISEQQGVVIHIGDEIRECKNTEYTLEISKNIIRIEQSLDVLEQALSKYPEGMLAQLERTDCGLSGLSRLHIYLSGGMIPIGDESIESIGMHAIDENESYVVLDMNRVFDLENTIYHEIFHAIEQYVNYDGGFYVDDNWKALNPEGFSYDYGYIENQDNTDVMYTLADGTGHAYFVDLYSKSYPHEDRARIMEYAMLDEGVSGERMFLMSRFRTNFDIYVRCFVKALIRPDGQNRLHGRRRVIIVWNREKNNWIHCKK